MFKNNSSNRRRPTSNDSSKGSKPGSEKKDSKTSKETKAKSKDAPKKERTPRKMLAEHRIFEVKLSDGTFIQKKTKAEDGFTHCVVGMRKDTKRAVAIRFTSSEAMAESCVKQFSERETYKDLAIVKVKETEKVRDKEVVERRCFEAKLPGGEIVHKRSKSPNPYTFAVWGRDEKGVVELVKFTRWSKEGAQRIADSLVRKELFDTSGLSNVSEVEDDAAPLKANQFTTKKEAVEKAKELFECSAKEAVAAIEQDEDGNWNVPTKKAYKEAMAAA